MGDSNNNYFPENNMTRQEEEISLLSNFNSQKGNGNFVSSFLSRKWLNVIPESVIS